MGARISENLVGESHPRGGPPDIGGTGKEGVVRGEEKRRERQTDLPTGVVYQG